jgi:hypothetical protein
MTLEPAESAESESLPDSTNSPRGECLQIEDDRFPLQTAGGRFYQLWSQLTLAEISGSFGDLGTFIPLFTALARQGSIFASSALFLSGFSNVVTGYVMCCLQVGWSAVR